MIKIGSAVYSCAAMMIPPIICSFLDQIDNWHEPLLLLSTAFAWPVASQLDNTFVADKVFGGLVFVGAVVWLFVLVLPVFTRRLQRIWYYAFQFAYSSVNAWLGIMIIGTKHC